MSKNKCLQWIIAVYSHLFCTLNFGNLIKDFGGINIKNKNSANCIELASFGFGANTSVSSNTFIDDLVLFTFSYMKIMIISNQSVIITYDETLSLWSPY